MGGSGSHRTREWGKSSSGSKVRKREKVRKIAEHSISCGEWTSKEC